MENLVRELRQKHDYSQEDLGDLLDVSRQTIISIESGRYNPSLELAFKISAIFGLPIENIFLFKEDV